MVPTTPNSELKEVSTKLRYVGSAEKSKTAATQRVYATCDLRLMVLTVNHEEVLFAGAGHRRIPSDPTQIH